MQWFCYFHTVGSVRNNTGVSTLLLRGSFSIDFQLTLSPTQSHDHASKVHHGATYNSAYSLGDAGDRRFVVVVPADSPGPDLCKVITSAIAIGYPSPIIVNWGKDFHKGGSGFGSSHLGKIMGTLEYLDGVTGESGHDDDKLRDDDLVLIVDAYDIWFQLPPEVLIRRYHQNNQLANERLAEQWAGRNLPMKQTILVSSQKKCFPQGVGSDLHCGALPDSPLPSDLYGASTDMNPEKNPNGYHDVRPKFLNSGSIMGPVGDMRRFLRRAKHKVDSGIANEVHLFSDQGVFSEILGEQEAWRSWQRLLKTSSKALNREASAIVQQNMEYHVGLDYYQNLFIPTVMEDDDGQFVSPNNATAIARYSDILGISPVRVNGVPEDLRGVHNPLADLEHVQGKLSWEEMPMYTDFFTTAVPAVVHHNAHKDGRKNRRTTWWDRTWYFPHLRDLMTMQTSRTQLEPLAKLKSSKGGQVVYWAPASDSQRHKPRNFNVSASQNKELMGELDFNDVCRFEDEGDSHHWYNEVFRDNKGGFEVI